MRYIFRDQYHATEPRGVVLNVCCLHTESFKTLSTHTYSLGNLVIMSKLHIRPMKESDLVFVRRGLSDTNWQDIPEDQRSVLKREDCDKRVFDDFDYFMKTEKYNFKVFIATSNDYSPIGYVSVGETANPTVGLKLGSVLRSLGRSRVSRQGRWK